jgi:cullin-associated NEDD8-dissociated protein 1
MGLLLAATAVDASLIREVDLGPFKHRIDDGLDLRKAAYECLDGLLDRPATRAALDAPASLARLEAGLADHPDVKLPCQLLLVKLAAAAPAATRAAVDRLLPPLDAAVAARPSPSAVQQEVDRADDLARAALRAVDALGRVPGVAAMPAYRTYVSGLEAGPAAAKWAAVREEGRAADLGAFGGVAGGGADGAGAEAMDMT